MGKRFVYEFDRRADEWVPKTKQIGDKTMNAKKYSNTVKTIAVENFCGSLQGMTKSDALQNLRMDAKLYKWNAATVRAIQAGIGKHFAR